MNLNRKNYIFEYIENKTKFNIKKFECDRCHQIFIYIVPINSYYVECCNCKLELTEIEI